jgi:hypothetical protein
MTLPTGSWTIDANGFRGHMDIAGVDGAGNLNATLTIDAPRVDQMEGFWDDGSKKITFIRVLDASTPSRNQIYTGYYWNNSRDRPTDLTHFLAGEFEAFRGTGATASRVLYGWVAEITIPG